MRCQHLNNIMKKDFTVCKLMWDAGVFNPDVFVNNHCDWFFSDVEEIKRLLHVYLKTFGVLFFFFKVPLLQSSESALWGWGCSAAAPGATWRSVLGSAAGPAWSGRPRGTKQIVNTQFSWRWLRRWEKLLDFKVCKTDENMYCSALRKSESFLKSSCCHRSSKTIAAAFHLRPVLAPQVKHTQDELHSVSEDNREDLQCPTLRTTAGCFICVRQSVTHLLLVLCGDLTLPGTEASSRWRNTRNTRTLQDKHTVSSHCLSQR